MRRDKIQPGSYTCFFLFKQYCKKGSLHYEYRRRVTATPGKPRRYPDRSQDNRRLRNSFCQWENVKMFTKGSGLGEFQRPLKLTVNTATATLTLCADAAARWNRPSCSQHGMGRGQTCQWQRLPPFRSQASLCPARPRMRRLYAPPRPHLSSGMTRDFKGCWAAVLSNNSATSDPGTCHGTGLYQSFFYYMSFNSGGNFESDLEESFKSSNVCDYCLENKVLTLGHNHNNENLYVTQASKYSLWNMLFGSLLFLQKFYLVVSWLTITILYCDCHAIFTKRFRLCVESQRKCHLWHSLHYFKLFQIPHNISHIFIDF